MPSFKNKGIRPTSSPHRSPTIGNVSILLKPKRPTAYLPTSMVRMYPMRKDALDDKIRYFALTILSHRQPELFAVMPGGALVVFSMKGIYPVMPGVPVYDVASPVFTKVTIHLKNGKEFVIAAPASSRDNKYVQSVRWNGITLDPLWVEHKDVANGGTLELTMGDLPNTSLGSQERSLPPASMMVDPSRFE